MYRVNGKENITLDLDRNMLIKDGEEVALNTEYVKEPSMVYLKLNNLCNIQCIYCFQRHESREGVNYNLQDYEYLLKDALEKENSDLVVFGGEPFIQNNVEKLDYIFSLSPNKSLVFFTNASYDQFFNEYINNNKGKIRQVMVTIDGPEEIHNVRRVAKQNGYRNIINNLHYFTDNKIPFGLTITVDMDNIDHAERMIEDLSKEFDMRRIPLTFTRVQQVDDKISDMVFLEKYKEIREKFMNYPLGINYPTVQKLKFLLGNKGLYPQRCRVGNINVYDFQTKRVYACPESSDTIIGTFDTEQCTIDHQLHSKMRDTVVKNNDHCSQCKFVNFCKYGCYLEDESHYATCQETTQAELKFILDNYSLFE